MRKWLQVVVPQRKAFDPRLAAGYTQVDILRKTCPVICSGSCPGQTANGFVVLLTIQRFEDCLRPNRILDIASPWIYHPIDVRQSLDFQRF